MAVACGVIGYQALTYYFYGNWPTVSFAYVVGEVVGDFPTARWGWLNAGLAALGKLPFAAVAFVVSYLLLLASDLLRGEGRRQTS